MQSPDRLVHWRDTQFFGLRPTLTSEQERYLDAIYEKQLVIVNAQAGTGKTTLAVGAAKLIGKPLLYVFNPCEEDKLGFTPGYPEEKEAKYLGPLYDALLEINENPVQAIRVPDDSPDAKRRNQSAWVTARSHVYMRGCNVKGQTVIIDEAQNWTVLQLRKMLTRIHDDCKVIVIGHTGQVDLPDPALSGFAPLIEYFRPMEYTAVCTLTKNFRGRLSTDADNFSR